MTLLSEGATKISRPGLDDPEQRRTSQLAITGLFAPTSSGGKVVTSVFPELRNPEVAVDILRGDLGLDDGRVQSIFTVSAEQVESGALARVPQAQLRPEPPGCSSARTAAGKRMLFSLWMCWCMSRSKSRSVPSIERYVPQASGGGV